MPEFEAEKSQLQTACLIITYHKIIIILRPFSIKKGFAGL
jgi:hypothetical protein